MTCESINYIVFLVHSGNVIQSRYNIPDNSSTNSGCSTVARECIPLTMKAVIRLSSLSWLIVLDETSINLPCLVCLAILLEQSGWLAVSDVRFLPTLVASDDFCHSNLYCRYSASTYG